MYISRNRIRLHDIDIAGRLYFPKQFRLVHEALEDFMESEGIPFSKLFVEKKYLFVIVHCETDYMTPLFMGDHVELQVYVEKIGNSSFTLAYDIFKEEGIQCGRAKTVHVAIDPKSGEKILLPAPLKEILEKHI